MRKGNLMGKIFGIALVFAMIGGLVSIGGGIANPSYVDASSSYNAPAAVNYADYWCNAGPNPHGYNPNYHDYSSEGGDCANFVSQCLIAGGLDLSSGSHVDGDCGCIIRCSWLHNFLVNDLGATWETRPEGQDEPLWFVPGDPAIFGYSDAHPRTHAVFAVTGDATHYATCNAHSTDRYHKTIQWFFTQSALYDPNPFDRCTYYHIPVDILQPPYPPTLISPGSGSYPGPTIDTRTPTFQWNSGANADYYGLYIRDLDTDVLVFNSEVDYGPIYGTSFDLPESNKLEYGTHYRWNMASHNSAGWSYDLGTGFSDKLWFTTEAATGHMDVRGYNNDDDAHDIYIYIGICCSNLLVIISIGGLHLTPQR